MPPLQPYYYTRMLLGELYASNVKTVALCLVYAPLWPLAYPLVESGLTSRRAVASQASSDPFTAPPEVRFSMPRQSCRHCGAASSAAAPTNAPRRRSSSSKPTRRRRRAAERRALLCFLEMVPPKAERRDVGPEGSRVFGHRSGVSGDRSRAPLLSARPGRDVFHFPLAFTWRR